MALLPQSPAHSPSPQLVYSHTHQCLHNGMVGGVHVGVQREGTLPLTVVGGIAFWRNDPVLWGQGSVGVRAVCRARGNVRRSKPSFYGPDCRAPKSKTP